jgi:proteasome lid subunit RPN8/RPN11
LAGSRKADFQVVIRDDALAVMNAHAASNTKVEVCGVMVGRVYSDDFGCYLLIHAAIQGDEASSKAAQVTFTAKTWAHIHEVMDRDYPEDRLAGWYHTHPGFDVFLSGMDHFIQDNFFNLPWQVAFVLDPLAKDTGMFVWRDGKTEREEILIERTQAASQLPPSPVTSTGRSMRLPSLRGLFVTALTLLLFALIIHRIERGPIIDIAGEFKTFWQQVKTWIDGR